MKHLLQPIVFRWHYKLLLEKSTSNYYWRDHKTKRSCTFILLPLWYTGTGVYIQYTETMRTQLIEFVFVNATISDQKLANNKYYSLLDFSSFLKVW